MQANPHVVPSHVADAFDGGAHGEQDEPHDAMLPLLAHDVAVIGAAGQPWLPGLHVKPQLPLVHVAVPLAIVAHAAHEPQWAGSVLRLASQPFAGLPSQSAKPVLQLNPHAPAAHVADALARALHTMPQPPHAAVLLVVDVSQPLVRTPSQLA